MRLCCIFYRKFYLDVRLSITNCYIAAPAVYEDITCEVAITKVGSLNYQFSIETDFGNGFVQSIVLTNTNTSATVMFRTQYQTAGNYIVKFRVPLINAEWNLNQVQIYGKLTDKNFFYQNNFNFD